MSVIQPHAPEPTEMACPSCGAEGWMDEAPEIGPDAYACASCGKFHLWRELQEVSA